MHNLSQIEPVQTVLILKVLFQGSFCLLKSKTNLGFELLRENLRLMKLCTE